MTVATPSGAMGLASAAEIVDPIRWLLAEPG